MRSRPIHNALLVVLLLASQVATALELKPLLVEVIFNEVPSGDAFVLLDEDGGLYAETRNLIAWRVKQPYPEEIPFRGRDFFRLSDFPGVAASIDLSQYRVVVSFPPSLLEDSGVVLSAPQPPKPESSTGFTMDYDLSLQDSGSSLGMGQAALFQPTVFSPAGFLTSGITYADFEFEPPSGDNLPNDWTRLETTWGRDIPSKMLSVRIGDSTTGTGTWGRAIRFGGFRIGTNFATQPNLITFPLPSIEGITAIPSALDLYVNNTLAYSEDIPSGPFSIRDVPVVSGSGQVHVVIRDILGREQVLVQDFYASPELLRKGLMDFSFSAGVSRKDFGIKSNNYGDVLAEMTSRKGLTNSFTLEGRTEFSEQHFNAGLTGFYQAGRFGIVTTGFALSVDDDSNDGTLYTLGYEYLGDQIRFNANVLGTSDDFMQLGFSDGAKPPQLQAALGIGYHQRTVGSYGATFVRQDFHDGLSRDIATLTFLKTFTNLVSFSATASFINTESGDDVAGSVNFSVPLGGRRSFNTSLRYDQEDFGARAEVRSELPVGTGYGYRVSAETGFFEVYEADVDFQNDFQTYTLEARSFDGEFAWRAGVAGSFAYLDGDTYFARQLFDGFVVVDLADYSDVRVYLENQEVGTTNKEGKVLLPGLRPYQTNRLRIDARDLPMNTRITALATEVAPYFRSGILVEFPIGPARAGILRLIDEAGQPIRAGAVATIDGRSEIFPVGKDGLLYLTGLDSSKHVRVKWNGDRCELEVPAPVGDEPLPDLGEHTCVTTETH